VAHGEVPHRDFVEDYGPGVFVALGALVRGGDGEILFVRQALAVWKALAVVLGFALARLLVPWPVGLGVGLLSIVFWGRASLNVNAPHAALLTIPLCMLAALVLGIAMKRDEDDARTRSLLFAAGAVAGGAVLFKQSLGVMNAYGLALAIAAVTWAGLDEDDPHASDPGRRGIAVALAAWCIAGIALLVPGARYLGATEYLAHIAAIHAFMVCVAIALWRRDAAPAFADFIRRRALPFALGGGLPLAAAALFYLSSGHLDDLWTGMFERPLRRRNYATAAMTPPASISLFVLGVAALLGGAFSRAARRATRVSLATGLAGLVLIVVAWWGVPHANPKLYTPKVLARSATIFDWVVHTIVLSAAVATFGPRIARGASEPGERARLRALMPVFFFSGLLCFQIFPRGAHNVWLAHPAWMPLLGIVAFEPWRRFAATATPARRVVMACVLLAGPLWLAYPVAARTWRLRDAPARALALPRTEGMRVQLSSVEQWHLADVEALVADLETRPDGPLLLVGGDVMLHYLTGRPPLRPEHEYEVYNVVLDMLPLRELAALDDGEWVTRLRAEAHAVVVIERDRSGARVLEALPSLDAYLRSRYRPTTRYGRYEVWEPISPPD
jgi:hypothetical protein